jgi:HSP20 family protein
MIKQKKSFLDKIVGTEQEVRHMGGEEIEVQKESSLDYGEDLAREEGADKPVMPEQIWDQKVESEDQEEEGQLAIDVYQTEDSIVIKSIIGGIKPEDLDLTVTNDMITIKGSRDNSEELVGNDYYYQECFWGSFSRSVILPCDIRVDGVEASMKNGVLTIKMPKVERNFSTKVEVRGE